MRRAWQHFLRLEPWIACIAAVVLTVVAFFVADPFLAVGLMLLTVILTNQYRAAAQAHMERQVQLLADDLVGGRLVGSLREADRWNFRGGTGSFLRTDTLPRLAERSRRTGKRIPVQVELINPSNEGVCASYVAYRSQADPYAKSGGRSWTARYVQAEIAASIVAAAHHAANSQLDIRFAFSDTSNALRFDVSHDEAVITSAYKGFPALVIGAECKLFASILTDLDLSFKSARVHFALDDAAIAIARPQPDAASVGKILMTLPAGLLPDDFSGQELEEVAARAVLSEFKK